MDYIISSNFDGCTVKDFLQKELKLSRKMITRLKNIDFGIVLNENKVTVRAVLHTNDRLSVSIDFESKPSNEILPVNLPLEILYEDDHYIAINKPPHMPTHPSHNHRDDTLANALSYIYSTQNKPFVFRAVNRLDRDTSGIVIFAKNADAAHRFANLQKNKQIQKYYLAVANGYCDESGTIEGYIRRKEKSIIIREFSKTKEHDDAAYSLTEYKTIATGDGASLLELLLHTGRTHQIRVHLQSIGHYILGDDLYGESNGVSRQMLHAYRMSFIHPYTKTEVTIKADIPKDIHLILAKKGIEYEL